MRLAVAIAFAALQATLATLAKPANVHHRSASAAWRADSPNRGSWRMPPAGYASDPGTVLSPTTQTHSPESALRTKAMVGSSRAIAGLSDGPSGREA
jgi:hypothetical protein